MTKTFTTLDELIFEEQERLLAQTRREIAAEQAAYQALPQSEKDRIDAERMAFFVDAPGINDEEEDDEDEDGDELEDEE